jgi:hypothetical protein
MNAIPPKQMKMNPVLVVSHVAASQPAPLEL